MGGGDTSGKVLGHFKPASNHASGHTGHHHGGKHSGDGTNRPSSGASRGGKSHSSKHLHRSTSGQDPGGNGGGLGAGTGEPVSGLRSSSKDGHSTRPKSAKGAASSAAGAGGGGGDGGLGRTGPSTIQKMGTSVGARSSKLEGTKEVSSVPRLLRRLLCCGDRGVRLYPMEKVLDEATQELVGKLEVSKGQLSKLSGIFESVDIGGTGAVYCSEILAHVDTVKSPFTDHVFQMVGADSDSSLTFCEFCRMLMTYCVFSKDDILHFLFRQYDTDDSGAIDEREFKELAKTVNNASPMFPGNFAKALNDFDVNADGLIDFDEFRAMDKAFPLLFFPAFRLQDSLQNHFLGSAFWLKTQENLLTRQAIEDYKATHEGKAPGRGWRPSTRGNTR